MRFNFINLFLVVVLLLVCGRVTAQRQIGQSPAQIKRDILNSFLFKGADIFYGSATFRPISDEPVALADSDRTLLDKQVQDLFGQLIKEYKRKREVMAAYLGLPDLPKNLKLQVLLTNNRGGANIQEAGSGYAIRISQSLIQSDYRASLLTALTPAVREAIKKSADSLHTQLDTTVSEAKVFDAMKNMKKNVEQYSTNIPNLFSSDMGSGLDFMLGYFQMADLGHAMEVLEKQYLGTLLFALAHEMGHAALGTVVKPDGAGADWFRKSEIDADRFATCLLSNVFMVLGVETVRISNGYNSGNMYFLEKADAEGFLGYSIFFNKAYELTYQSSPGYDPGAYPDPAERLDASKNIFSAVFVADRPKIIRKFERRQYWSVLTGGFSKRITEAFGFL